MSYDTWKTTEPDQRRYEAGTGVSYRCLDCTWRGKAAQAVDHHRQQHHRIATPNNLIAQFSCCKGAQSRKGAA